jgi:hypothetical protein
MKVGEAPDRCQPPPAACHHPVKFDAAADERRMGPSNYWLVFQAPVQQVHMEVGGKYPHTALEDFRRRPSPKHCHYYPPNPDGSALGWPPVLQQIVCFSAPRAPTLDGNKARERHLSLWTLLGVSTTGPH